MRREGYDVAQICVNGHVINSDAVSSPSFNKKFCDECGAETIMHCPTCNEPIKESYHSTDVFFGIGFEAPKFCDNCGNMYTWTANQIQVVSELIELAENISQGEKDNFNSNILDLVKETPKVPLAQIKVQRLISKIDKGISDGIHDALERVISQTIQENIWK